MNRAYTITWILRKDQGPTTKEDIRKKRKRRANPQKEITKKPPIKMGRIPWIFLAETTSTWMEGLRTPLRINPHRRRSPCKILTNRNKTLPKPQYSPKSKWEMCSTQLCPNQNLPRRQRNIHSGGVYCREWNDKHDIDNKIYRRATNYSCLTQPTAYDPPNN